MRYRCINAVGMMMRCMAPGPKAGRGYSNTHVRNLERRKGEKENRANGTDKIRGTKADR